LSACTSASISTTPLATAVSPNWRYGSLITVLLDEPESALSPQRQLTLLSTMYGLVKKGGAQFIVSTHSPILLTYPGAQIISFDDGALAPISLEETSHYQVTLGILEQPENYWAYLKGGE